MPAVPLRANFDAVAVRRAAQAADDTDQVRRLLAIAAVYDGTSRAGRAPSRAKGRSWRWGLMRTAGTIPSPFLLSPASSLRR